MKKIAVPITSNNKIVDYFGRSMLYEIYVFSKTNKILDVQLLEPDQGSGCKSNIVNVLASAGVIFLLSANIGNKAMHKFNKAGIDVVRGCTGDSADIILKFVENEIKDSGVPCLKYYPNHRNSHDHVCNH